jgi:hypothetical protein
MRGMFAIVDGRPGVAGAKPVWDAVVVGKAVVFEVGVSHAVSQAETWRNLGLADHIPRRT